MIKENIRKADKSNTVVILDKKDYRPSVRNILGDTSNR